VDFSNFDLSQLPKAEDDHFEFKSSVTPAAEVKQKLSRAISGFGNSGGGCFVLGVDGKGDADGGVSLNQGRQDIRDWADQIIHQVEPTPRYDIKLISDPNGRGTIKAGNSVLVVCVADSEIGPHIAPDNRFYIRAGAHTVAARGFIVEALWAKRHFSKPRLTHVFRAKPEYSNVIQLGIVALTDSPAIDVEVSLSKMPALLKEVEGRFPLKLSLIDRANPFWLDVTLFHFPTEQFGDDIELQIKYLDLGRTSYNLTAQLDLTRALPPVRIGSDSRDEIVRTLKAIERSLERQVKVLERKTSPDD